MTKHKLTMSTVETVAGGLVSARLVSVPGASDWFKGGVVAYSREAKLNLLGIDDYMLGVSSVTREVADLLSSHSFSKLQPTFAFAETSMSFLAPGARSKKIPGTSFMSVYFGRDGFARKAWTIPGYTREAMQSNLAEESIKFMLSSLEEWLNVHPADFQD